MDVEYSRQKLQEITNNTSRQNGEPSHEDQIRFNKLCKSARKAAEAGQPRDALECYKKAGLIHNTEKITRRIAKLEAYLAEHGSDDSEEEESGMIHVGKGFSVYKDVYNKMYPHQRDAMLWFWRLHRKQKGGILGDDMGLGKTIQVIAYLSGLFDMDQVHGVLLILPVAVIINWEREFEKWAPGIRLETFHGANKRERLRSLAKVQRHGGVLMTSYGLVVTNWEALGTKDGQEFIWDYTILDEGHKIKNPSKTTKACHAVASKHRFILTGTPVQNNLKEFWQLFDFVSQGTLLGTRKTFSMEYSGPITRAREKDATPSEKLLGDQMAESLRQIIAPYFLRRTKAAVLEQNKENQRKGDDETDRENKPGTSQKVVSFPTLTRKNDLVVWCYLSDQQIKIYKDFLELDQVKELLMTSRSPLVELTVLKKLCDHLRLLSLRACMQLGMETGIKDYDDNDEAFNRKSAADQIHHMSNQELLAESGKLQMLMDLLKALSMGGHRTLVFSQSRKMLDIIGKLLKTDNFKFLRLDGTITKLDDRQQIINKFQKNRTITVFLLTTQVGGVGLTLTGADRVVIFDPSWNPATDNQAVDRVYRIGQKERVVVYRLITCGTVEEKIYRRQIFKESITAQTVGNTAAAKNPYRLITCSTVEEKIYRRQIFKKKSITAQTVGNTAAAKNPYRYFTKGELKELFTLGNPKHSTTQVQLEQMHSAQRKTDVDLDEHIAFLYSLDIFGISDHDLMFSKEAVIDHGADGIEEADDYVQERVRKGKELVMAEGELRHKLNVRQREDTEGSGSSNRMHALFTDRNQLLEEAMRQGHKVDLPTQRPMWNDHGVRGEPSNVPQPEVVDLDEYNDSYVDDVQNSTQRSSTSTQPGNDLSQSFLQDVISTLSQEEIDLNMKLLQEAKRGQQARIKEEINIESDLDESSILEEVNISSASPVESSFEDVEVVDQSMQAEGTEEDNQSNGLDPESSMEEVEVADQSLQTSVHNHDGDVMNVSMKAMTLQDDNANLSMDDIAKADTLDVDDLDLHIPTPSRSARKSTISIPPSPLSIDRSKPRRTLLISDTFNDSIPNARIKASLVEESPMAITPVLSDESEIRKKRKSNEDTPSSGEKRKYVEDEESSDNDESLIQPFRARDRAMRIDDLDESEDNSVFQEAEGIQVIQDSEDEDETDIEDETVEDEDASFEDESADSLEDESTSYVGDKSTSYVADESTSYVADESTCNVDGLGDETQRGSYLAEVKRKSPIPLVVNDSMSKIPTPKEALQHRFDDVSLEQSKSGEQEPPSDEDGIDLQADDTVGTASLNEEDLEESKNLEESKDLEESKNDVDLELDDTSSPQRDDEQVQRKGKRQNISSHDESMQENLDLEESQDDVDLEHDDTMDGSPGSPQRDYEQVQGKDESLKTSSPDESQEEEFYDTMDDSPQRDDEQEQRKDKRLTNSSHDESMQEENPKEDGEDQSMTLDSEEAFEDGEEQEDEEQDSDYEEEEGEDYEDGEEDEYTKLVREGEQYLINGEESQGLTCFLQALKIDKSNRELQVRTLALYQKLST